MRTGAPRLRASGPAAIVSQAQRATRASKRTRAPCPAPRAEGGGANVPCCVPAPSGHWGKCTLAEAGRLQATALAPAIMQLDGSGFECTEGEWLVRSPAELDDWLRQHGGTSDGGAPFASVNFGTESLVIIGESLAEYAVGQEGATLVVTRGNLCSGARPPCSLFWFRTPKVTRMDVVPCPPPREPCTAP